MLWGGAEDNPIAKPPIFAILRFQKQNRCARFSVGETPEDIGAAKEKTRI